MYDSFYQDLGKSYLEHYGVKGMKWGKHKKKISGTPEPHTYRDQIPYNNLSPSSSKSMPYGVINLWMRGNSVGSHVDLLDKDGNFVKRKEPGDEGIPASAIEEYQRKMNTMMVAQKRFEARGKKVLERESKTKMSSLNSMKVQTGKEKIQSVLTKIKNAIPKLPTKVKSPR